MRAIAAGRAGESCPESYGTDATGGSRIGRFAARECRIPPPAESEPWHAACSLWDMATGDCGLGRRGEEMSGAPIDRLILGRSSAIAELRREIEQLAASPLRAVLVLGETGVGKDLVPRALHMCSSRRRGRLVVFNCPAVPADHLESELFGTTRGAYTGAVERPGAVQRANGGWLVLDEIGAMPLAHQAKILRLLETGEARRLGAAEPERIDAAFAAATNEDLALAVREGRFREDLYYRLVQDAVLFVPPLRERREDVPILAQAFLAEIDAPCALLAAAVEVLQLHDWPGNVRELRAVVRTASRLAAGRQGSSITPEDVGRAIRRIPTLGPERREQQPTEERDATFNAATDQLRRQMLIDALAAAEGNQTLAGVMLGMHERQRGAATGRLDTRARKLAHRKFGYWWNKLVGAAKSRTSEG